MRGGNIVAHWRSIEFPEFVTRKQFWHVPPIVEFCCISTPPSRVRGSTDYERMAI